MKSESLELRANGLVFPASAYGSGPLVLCMHGFPDTPQSFRHQIEPLVDAGYRVVTPYMRGYAPSAIPDNGIYQGAALGQDVIALIDSLGEERAVLFGHDWGAMAVQFAALIDPGRISKMITAALPCSPSMPAAIMSSYRQQKRFWYQYFFQLPVAEALVAADEFRFIRELWRDWSPSWRYSEDDIAPVLRCLSQPGVLHAALAYYKAVYDPSLHSAELAELQGRWAADAIVVPTLHIHGLGDECIGVELCDGMEVAYPAGLQKALIEGAGHFVHQERPAEVNEVILGFLAD